MQSHHRIGEYFIGIIFGFFLYDFEVSTKFRNSLSCQFLTFFCWFLSLAFLASHIYLEPKLFLNQTGQNIYDAVSRDLWALSICWIIFACHHLQSGSIIRTILSLPFWQPLSKMCLSIYLTHFIYIMMTMANFKTRLVVETWWEIHILVGDVFISIAFALIFYIAIEAPIANVTAIMWKKVDKEKVSRTTNVENVVCIKVKSLKAWA